MRVLVIGGAGFIGPDVVRRLSDRGHEVAVFHRGQAQADLGAQVRHILGDRHNLAASVGELRRFAPDVVLDMFPFNDADARAVLDAVRGVARRVVAISSQDVYRAYGRLTGIEPGPPDPVPYAEDAPLRERLYPYRGKLPSEEDYEKILAEQVVLSDPEMAGTVLRLPMVYGPRDKQHRLFEYLKRIDDGRRAILVDETLAGWRWTRGDVENVADAIVLAVVKEEAAGRVYNVGEPQALTLADWIRAIGQAAGWTGEVIPVPQALLPSALQTSLDGAQDLVADTTRIRVELGYGSACPSTWRCARRSPGSARIRPHRWIPPSSTTRRKMSPLLGWSGSGRRYGMAPFDKTFSETEGGASMVTIRPMEEGDLPSVTALTTQLGYPSTLGAIARRYRAIVASDEYALYVAEVGAAVAGWVYVRGVLLLEDDARAEVWGLVVEEQRRRQGIGEALMREAEQWARAAGYRAVSLRSNVTRTGTHAFYRRIGYATTKMSHIFWKALAS